MSETVISVENLSKCYRLGIIGGATLRDDMTRWWAALRGKPDPFVELAKLHPDNRFDGYRWALRGIDLDVQKGEILGVIGNNGAGKSTLLKILSQITAPTSGRAVIRGRVGSLLEVGTGFHLELTGRENIYLNGTILGMKKWEVARKFDDIVEFSEVAEFIDTPVKRYSSGMRVRLAFAVAAHLEPEILIIDEVLAVGDAAFQRKCLGKMEDVSRQGRTILFVSHNMLAIQNLCSRTVWLRDGRLQQDGPTAAVVADYLAEQSDLATDVSWPALDTAPGNEHVRLLRVWIETDSERNAIVREKPIRIGVDYWKSAPDTEIHVTLQVLADHQIVAFTAAASADPSLREEERGRSGRFRSVCHIPECLLNAGQYSVSVLMVKDRSRTTFALSHALAFEVLESHQRESGWYGKEPGVVRPDLQWTNGYLGTSAGDGAP